MGTGVTSLLWPLTTITMDNNFFKGRGDKRYMAKTTKVTKTAKETKTGTDQKKEVVPESTAVEQPKIYSLTDFITQPLNTWIEYMKENAVKYYKNLLKINLASIAAFVVPIIVFGAMAALLFFLLGGTKIPNMLAMVVSGFVLLVGIILAGWASDSIEMTRILYTDAEFSGKPFNMVETAKMISGKVLRYLIADVLIWTLLMIPAAIIFFLFLGGWVGLSALGTKTGSSGFLLALLGFLAGYMLIFVYLVAATFLHNFLLQFWKYGFLLENLGIRESLKKSISIIKRRPLEVFVFNLVSGIIAGGVLSIPLIIYGVLAQIGFNIIQLSLLLGPIGWVIIIVAIIIHLIINTILGTIPEAFAVPTHYLVWKMAKDSKSESK